jgi:ureidoglycolate hydrolase
VPHVHAAREGDLSRPLWRVNPIAKAQSISVHSISALERRHCSTQALIGLTGDTLQLGVLADDAERCNGRHRGHRASTGFGFVHNHIAQ